MSAHTLTSSKIFKAIIVEDELKSLRNLKNMLRSECPQVEVIADAVNIESALELFDDPSFKPDVAFLDINLTDGLVFSMLEKLRPIDFEVIFVTAYNEYAIKACEYSSIGYIMKPIDPEQLRLAVGRIRHKGEKMDARLDMMNQQMTKPNAFEKLSISATDGIYFVHLKDIIRFEAEDNYTHIYTQNEKKITASKTLKFYEDQLSGHNFFRVHKGHIVNLNYMVKFKKGEGSYIEMNDGKRIDVSRRRRPAFMEKLGGLRNDL